MKNPVSLALVFLLLSLPVRPAQDDLLRLYKWNEMDTLESVLAPLEANPKGDLVEPLVAALTPHVKKIRGPAGSPEKAVESWSGERRPGRAKTEPQRSSWGGRSPRA